MRHIFLNSRENGATLIEILVSVSVLAVFGVLAAQFARGYLTASAIQYDQNERNVVATILRDKINCRNTGWPYPPNCVNGAPNPYIDVKDHKGNVIVSKFVNNPLNYIGDFHIRALCSQPIDATTLQPVILQVRKELPAPLGEPRPVAKNPRNSREEYPWINLFEVPRCAISP